MKERVSRSHTRTKRLATPSLGCTHSYCFLCTHTGFPEPQHSPHPPPPLKYPSRQATQPDATARPAANNTLLRDFEAYIPFSNAIEQAQSQSTTSTEPPPLRLPTPAPLPGDCQVQAFVQAHVTPYRGNASFLAPPTARTREAWQRCEELLQQEQANRGVLDVDTVTPSTITSHKPGYLLDAQRDIIVGLQTDAPLRRACKPKGGFASVSAALKCYGYTPDPAMEAAYGSKGPIETHHKLVSDTYTAEMR